MLLVELREKWASLAVRERQALKLLLGFVTLAVGIQLGWTSHVESRRLEKSLPQLQQRLFEMRQWAGEAQTLSGQASGKEWGASEVLSRLNGKLKSGEILITSAQTVIDGDGRVRVAGSAKFAVCLELIAMLQSDFRYFPVSASVSPESSGVVRFDVVFSTTKF